MFKMCVYHMITKLTNLQTLKMLMASGVNR